MPSSFPLNFYAIRVRTARDNYISSRLRRSVFTPALGVFSTQCHVRRLRGDCAATARRPNDDHAATKRRPRGDQTTTARRPQDDRPATATTLRPMFFLQSRRLGRKNKQASDVPVFLSSVPVFPFLSSVGGHVPPAAASYR